MMYEIRNFMDTAAEDLKKEKHKKKKNKNI